MLAAMEDGFPVCDRFLSLGRFLKHATDDCISYHFDPEQSSLLGEGAKKNKVEALGIRGESMFLPPARSPYIPH